MYQPIHMQTFTTCINIYQPIAKEALTKGLCISKIDLNKTGSKEQDVHRNNSFDRQAYASKSHMFQP